MPCLGMKHMWNNIFSKNKLRMVGPVKKKMKGVLRMPPGDPQKTLPGKPSDAVQFTEKQ